MLVIAIVILIIMDVNCSEFFLTQIHIL